MKNINQYIDPVPTRINGSFRADYGEETIDFLWHDMDRLMNSVRDCLWKIIIDLDRNL
jgi:hypothetical protein